MGKQVRMLCIQKSQINTQFCAPVEHMEIGNGVQHGAAGRTKALLLRARAGAEDNAVEKKKVDGSNIPEVNFGSPFCADHNVCWDVESC